MHYLIRSTGQILLLLVCAGCSFAQTAPTPQWTKENVSGLHLSLDDPKYLEVLQFNARGNGVADIGIKNGAITGPGFQWSIVNNKLRIDMGSDIDELTLVSMDSSKVIVKKASGQIQEFTIIDPEANRSPVEKKLDLTILRKINFEALDITLVLSYLTTESKKLDPDHAGIKFLLRLPPNVTPTTRLLYRKVSITLDEVPFTEILHYISDQTNLEYKIEGDTVVFAPPDLGDSHPKEANK